MSMSQRSVTILASRSLETLSLERFGQSTLRFQFQMLTGAPPGQTRGSD